MSANPNVLLVLTAHDSLGDTGRATGYYVPEAAHPWRVFTEAGYRVDIATPTGAAPQPDAFDDSDPAQRNFFADHDVASQLLAPLRPAQIDPDEYDAIFYVGGHGAMWDFPDDAALAQLGAAVYESDGVVAAVCHGPAGLRDITLSDGSRLIANKRLTSFTDSEEAAVELSEVVPFLLETTLTANGATHIGADDFATNVIRDDRLVTGQNPASATGTAEAVVTALEERDRVAEPPS